MYIKACPYNLFELKPAYGKVSAVFFTLVIEVCIIELQKHLGPKFIIPACLKKKPYNYYIDNLNPEDSSKYNVIKIFI